MVLRNWQKAMRRFSGQRGFTLVELVVSVGILGILITLITVNLARFQTNASVSSVTSEVIAEMRSQQNKAINGDTENTASNSSYGIHFDANQYVLFRGTSYNALDTSNAVFPNPEAITFTNIQFPGGTVIFNSVSGEVSGFVAGQNTITITHSVSNEQKTVTLNRFGVITEVQ